MVTQDQLMLAAVVQPGRVAALRDCLAQMNRRPGEVDPLNPRLPFGHFDTIHFARVLVAEDRTLGDRAWYPGLPSGDPVYLLLLVDCDGSAEALLERLASEAKAGLRELFQHCEGFSDGIDLLTWLRAHQRRAAAFYVNWVGRTVRQVREEDALHETLRRVLHNLPMSQSPRELHRQLRQAAQSQGPALSPAEPRTPGQWLQLAGRAALLLLIGLLLLLPALMLAPPFFFWLRRHELRDPVIDLRADAQASRAIATGEDRDVTNPFSAIGSLKPGPFRLWVTRAALWALDQSCALLYHRGRLARVSTIHFARWVLLDDDRRVFFASNYDGSLESYMDDFINKVAFGLNLVFSNGIGYPPSDFLILRGAWQEQRFKHFLHRHQVATDVWYKAYPGLTNADLARNSRIRQGLQRNHLSEAALRRWLAEI